MAKRGGPGTKQVVCGHESGRQIEDIKVMDLRTDHHDRKLGK